jgi:hypothetical protein
MIVALAGTSGRGTLNMTPPAVLAGTLMVKYRDTVVPLGTITGVLFTTAYLSCPAGVVPYV